MLALRHGEYKFYEIFFSTYQKAHSAQQMNYDELIYHAHSKYEKIQFELDAIIEYMMLDRDLKVYALLPHGIISCED